MSTQEPGLSDTDTLKTHTKRYYVSEASGGKAKYVLPADEEEKERLDTQGPLINRLFDDKLIWAPVSLKDGDIVVDIGTGSGHWLLSVAKEVSAGVQLRGIDIQSRIFPPNPPPNATFSVVSAISLPADWTASISLIHQRLMLGSLEEHQWKIALKEMYRVLVPGGWVQLFEPDPNMASPSEAVRNHPCYKMRDKLCFEVRKVTLDVTLHLPGWLKEAGFVVHKSECRGMPLGSWAGEFGRTCGRVNWKVCGGMKELVLKEGGFGIVNSEEEYDALVEDLARLFDETPETYYNFYVHLAQKPIS